MQWLNHDSTAAGDDKMMALRMEHGGAAVDCYWAIIEKQYRDERRVPISETDRETKALAHRLAVGFQELEKYVETMLEIGLLKKDDDGNVYSERAEEAIDEYQKKCETARRNGKKGGRKPTGKPTAKPTPEPTPKPYKKRKEEKRGIGFDKQNLSLGSDGADAQGAPPEPPNCGTCEAPMQPTASFTAGKRRQIYRCPLCEATAEGAVA